VATSAANWVDRVRRFVRDIPDQDTLSVSLASTGTSVVVADTSFYRARRPIEIDYETMMVRTAPSTGTSLTVTRAWAGSTSATHAASAGILVRPAFYAQEILDALNMGIDACWPYIYKPVTDTTISTVANTYEYLVPNLPGSYPEGTYQIPIVTKVETLQVGELTYRETRRWRIVQGPEGTRYIHLQSSAPVATTLRVSGFGPFEHLSSTASTLNPAWPPRAQNLPILYAAAHLLMSAESGRDRSDTGATDRREEANRPGISLSTGQALMQRFYRELLTVAMPPLTKHVAAPL
jgi:hypothetical protein